jgi:UDP-N-acetylglucosamine transferase subunit ALG13
LILIVKEVEMTDHISFSLNPEATASTHDDGIVILHAGNGRLFTSNEAGARIWRGIEQRRSFEGIVDEISKAFQIAGATARVHTLNFLAALEHQALITREVAS